MIEYRMTYMWRILALLVFLPLGCLFIAMGVFPDDNTTQSSITWSLIIGSLFLVAVIMIWIYGYKKKVFLKGNEMSTQSIFGNKSIFITDQTEIIHQSIRVTSDTNFSGANLLFHAIAQTQGEEASTSVNISISDDNTSIKLNSNIKDIFDLKEKLIDIELNTILPGIKKLFQSGQVVSFGSIKLKVDQLIIGKRSIPISEIHNFDFQKRKLILKNYNKRRPLAKVKTKTIINLYSLLHLIN